MNTLAATFRVVRFPTGAGTRALARYFGIQTPVGLRQLIDVVWRHSSLDRIEHVFVIMLENRSFDHMLGFSRIRGVDAMTGRERHIDGLTGQEHNVGSDGQWHRVRMGTFQRFPVDPGHEHANAMRQISSDDGSGEPDNSGFVRDYELSHPSRPAGEIMSCLSPDQVPILASLAAEFAVCDRWFSSMPGPTFPNRFFVHAATAGGYDYSPSSLDLALHAAVDGYDFEHGSIFDRLDEAEIEWIVYAGDEMPAAWTIAEVNAWDNEDLEDLDDGLQEPDFPYSYVFIEPAYDVLDGYEDGTSQHPLGTIAAGERMIKRVYEALRASPHWAKSALVITYDEHGGFYDHVPPPRAVPPGDEQITEPEHGFAFDRLGARVPAVIVSPWIARGTVDGTVLDHCSILATLEQRFGLRPLTQRDAHAHTLAHLFRLPAPRLDAPMKLREPRELDLPPDVSAQASRRDHPSRPFDGYRDTSVTGVGAMPPALATALAVAVMREIKRTPEAERVAVREQLASRPSVGQLLEALEGLRERRDPEASPDRGARASRRRAPRVR